MLYGVYQHQKHSSQKLMAYRQSWLDVNLNIFLTPSVKSSWLWLQICSTVCVPFSIHIPHCSQLETVCYCKHDRSKRFFFILYTRKSLTLFWLFWTVFDRVCNISPVPPPPPYEAPCTPVWNLLVCRVTFIRYSSPWNKPRRLREGVEV
jgi:hypothetical protein